MRWTTAEAKITKDKLVGERQAHLKRNVIVTEPAGLNFLFINSHRAKFD